MTEKNSPTNEDSINNLTDPDADGEFQEAVSDDDAGDK
ncbi:hypothetical protein SAMN04488535_1163 [Corynebacterium mycetoides]|uniref:Uncharacterized protein n=1 Tax=Corynebacterium mycetoides TaxID=38302 RepID=A0A1G9NTF2_9CORY|nr:hypothetical protein SAMN04488535_1163 [Corynebacterium mycetoides]